MKRLILALAATALVAAVAAGSALAFGGGGHGPTLRWEVKITNLTPATGAGTAQPLSPPSVTIHNRRADVWQVGDPASAGVAAIAQDADNSILESALSGAPGVKSVSTAPTGGPILPGQSATFLIESDFWHNRISIVSMLVNTNDAFTGLDSKRLLPWALFFGRTFYVRAYDAGSELNDQLAANIPGPCCGDTGKNGTPTSEPISHHAGILSGVGDLDPNIHGWNGAVAKIEIRLAFHR